MLLDLEIHLVQIRKRRPTQLELSPWFQRDAGSVSLRSQHRTRRDLRDRLPTVILAKRVDHMADRKVSRIHQRGHGLPMNTKLFAFGPDGKLRWRRLRLRKDAHELTMLNAVCHESDPRRGAQKLKAPLGRDGKFDPSFVQSKTRRDSGHKAGLAPDRSLRAPPESVTTAARYDRRMEETESRS